MLIARNQSIKIMKKFTDFKGKNKTWHSLIAEQYQNCCMYPSKNKKSKHFQLGTGKIAKFVKQQNEIPISHIKINNLTIGHKEKKIRKFAVNRREKGSKFSHWGTAKNSMNFKIVWFFFFCKFAQQFHWAKKGKKKKICEFWQ